MRRLLIFACFCTGLSAQTIPLVPAVRDAAQQGDFALASRELAAAKSSQGVTPEYLEAASWVGRGQLAAKRYDAAMASAAEVRKQVEQQLTRRKLDADRNLPIALGATIEVTAQALAAQGGRDQAVTFLRESLNKYRGTTIVARVQKNLNLLTLEGKPAPALDTTHTVAGTQARPLSAHRNHPVLVFFWAHWCGDCKAEVEIVRKLNAAYAAKGLHVVAPTQHYGYVAGGDDAPRAKETAYINEIWGRYYAQLGKVEAPVSEANFLAYGVSTTPTLVLIDKAGVVRMYNPGNLTYEQLAVRIEKLL